MSHDAYHVPESIGGIVCYHIPHHYRIAESVVLQKIMFESYYGMSEICQTLHVSFSSHTTKSFVYNRQQM
jgi:hypothetical protein